MSITELKKFRRSPLGMRLYGLLTAVGAFPYSLWFRAFPGTIVLLYHRIGAVAVDPHNLAVSVENFDSQIAYLKQHTSIISVSELHQALQRGIVPKRSVVITFDDGYEDNYISAFPILKKYGVPATIFMTSNGDLDREIWIDELMQAIDPSNREYQELFEQYKQLSTSERNSKLQELFINKKTTPVVRNDYRRLNADQLREMIASELITIGGHTISHNKLSVLTKGEQENEINGNAEFIFSLGKQPTVPFAYPFGSTNDFTDTTVAIVARHYPIAFSAYHGHVTTKTNCHRIPRFIAKDWNAVAFSRKLKQFFGFV